MTTSPHILKRTLAAAGAALFALSAAAQAAWEEQFVVIHAGRIITVSGEEIEDGTIVIVDGKIRLVGKNLDYPADAEIIEARDQVVMPGMIHVSTRANLPSYSRNGNNSHRNVADDVIYEELDFGAFLRHGFTAVCLTPAGRGIPGMSTVYRTAGQAPEGDYEDDTRVLNERAYLPIDFSNPGRDKPALRGALSKAESEIEKVEKARKEWEEKQKKAAEEKKKQEQENKEKQQASVAAEDEKPAQENGQEEKPAEFQPPKIDPASQRFVDLIKEKADYPLLLEVSGASDFLHARHVLEAYEQIPRSYLLGDRFNSSDYNYVVDELVQPGMTLAIEPGMRELPDTATRYNLPGELLVRGAEVAFVPRNDSEPGLRRFRSDVADLVRAGLPRADAIRAMSINQAAFVGVDSRVGTIEKDKEADLIFLSGDPLDPPAEVKRVMILGRTVWQAEDDQ